MGKHYLITQRNGNKDERLYSITINNNLCNVTQTNE